MVKTRLGTRIPRSPESDAPRSALQLNLFQFAKGAKKGATCKRVLRRAHKKGDRRSPTGDCYGSLAIRDTERLVLYCRTSSASTAPRTLRRTGYPFAYVLINVLRVSHSCQFFADGSDLHLLLRLQPTEPCTLPTTPARRFHRLPYPPPHGFPRLERTQFISPHIAPPAHPEPTKAPAYRCSTRHCLRATPGP